MSKAEELQQKLNELQAELDALKEEEKKEPLKAMLPVPDNLTGYRLSLAMDFPDQETAEAYADVFRTILELRRQPGSGQLDCEGDGWIVECCGRADWSCDKTLFTLCPPFPSKELAEQAGETVGTERIKRAYATLSNIKRE